MTPTSGTTTITTPVEREIRVERTFAASRDRVWRAYTVPEQVAQWWGHEHTLDALRASWPCCRASRGPPAGVTCRR